MHLVHYPTVHPLRDIQGERPLHVEQMDVEGSVAPEREHDMSRGMQGIAGAVNRNEHPQHAFGPDLTGPRTTSTLPWML